MTGDIKLRKDMPFTRFENIHNETFFIFVVPKKKKKKLKIVIFPHFLNQRNGDHLLS